MKMLNTTKGFTAGAVLSVLASLILYQVVGFQETYDMGYSMIVFLLYPARLCLVFGILFAVLAILVYKGNVDIKKLKKPLVSAVSVACAVCIAVCGYAYSTAYTQFTLDDSFKNMPQNVQEMFPYFYKNNTDFSRYDVEYSHFGGTDYLYIFGAGNYKAEYLTSTSPFLNLQFLMEKIIITPFNESGMEVVADGIEKEVDGVSLISNADADDYAVRIDGFFHTFYVSLTNARVYETSLEDFEKMAVKQYGLIRQAVKDGVFSDDSIWPDYSGYE